MWSPLHCREPSLSTEPRVRPEHCQVLSPKRKILKKKTKNHGVSIIDCWLNLTHVFSLCPAKCMWGVQANFCTVPHKDLSWVLVEPCKESIYSVLASVNTSHCPKLCCHLPRSQCLPRSGFTCAHRDKGFPGTHSSPAEWPPLSDPAGPCVLQTPM